MIWYYIIYHHGTGISQEVFSYTTSGAAFGELALMYRQKRAVRSSVTHNLWVSYSLDYIFFFNFLLFLPVFLPSSFLPWLVTFLPSFLPSFHYILPSFLPWLPSLASFLGFFPWLPTFLGIFPSFLDFFPWLPSFLDFFLSSFIFPHFILPFFLLSCFLLSYLPLPAFLPFFLFSFIISLPHFLPSFLSYSLWIFLILCYLTFTPILSILLQATVRASTDGALWSIGRLAFRAVLMKKRRWADFLDMILFLEI